MRVCILATAVCTGAWLGIPGHTVNIRSAPLSSRSRTVHMRRPACTEINAAADFDVPPDYTLIDVKPIGQDCFALLKADGTEVSPVPGPANGFADVFGPDGRLTERLFAIERSDGQWEVFEYRRLPSSGAIQYKARG